MAAISQESVQKLLTNLFTVQVRRGGNYQINFAALGDFSHEIDDQGNEVASRDEVIMRAQLGQLDELREAGIPARLSNSRRNSYTVMKDGKSVEVEYWEYNPSIWVNQPGSQGASTAAVTARVSKLEAALEASLADNAAARADNDELKAMLRNFLAGGTPEAPAAEAPPL